MCATATAGGPGTRRRGHARRLPRPRKPSHNRRNRDQIYTITNRDVPFSAGYAPGATDQGLAARYSNDKMVSDCVRNTGTETDRATTYTPDATAKP